MAIQLLTVSSKGQISLPVSIRESMSISTGDKFVVYSSGDVIILKALRLPAEAEFEAVLQRAQEWAKNAGYKESDVPKLIKDTRKKMSVRI